MSWGGGDHIRKYLGKISREKRAFFFWLARFEAPIYIYLYKSNIKWKQLSSFKLDRNGILWRIYSAIYFKTVPHEFTFVIGVIIYAHTPPPYGDGVNNSRIAPSFPHEIRVSSAKISAESCNYFFIQPSFSSFALFMRICWQKFVEPLFYMICSQAWMSNFCRKPFSAGWNAIWKLKWWIRVECGLQIAAFFDVLTSLFSGLKLK